MFISVLRLRNLHRCLKMSRTKEVESMIFGKIYLIGSATKLQLKWTKIWQFMKKNSKHGEKSMIFQKRIKNGKNLKRRQIQMKRPNPRNRKERRRRRKSRNKAPKRKKGKRNNKSRRRGKRGKAKIRNDSLHTNQKY